MVRDTGHAGLHETGGSVSPKAPFATDRGDWMCRSGVVVGIEDASGDVPDVLGYARVDDPFTSFFEQLAANLRR